MSEEHETSSFALKTAEVDLKIQPLIRWMNNFDHVYTHYCCEGDQDKRKAGSEPYVVFTCHEEITLVYVLYMFRSWAKVEIEFYKGSLRYIARFISFEHLMDFQSKILENKECVLHKLGSMLGE